MISPLVWAMSLIGFCVYVAANVDGPAVITIGIGYKQTASVGHPTLCTVAVGPGVMTEPSMVPS